METNRTKGIVRHQDLSSSLVRQVCLLKSTISAVIRA
jgi:hypothetical protein